MRTITQRVTCAAVLLAVAGCGAGGTGAAGGPGKGETPRSATPSPAEVEQAAARSSQAVGKPAPDFALQDQDGRTVRLADLRGRWVVLYFYPKDDTPGCTCQATEFTDLLGQFRDMNATVLGVSADPPDAHRHFRRKYTLALTLLSDPDRQAARAYGAWSDDPWGGAGGGRTSRQTYLVDPDGKIARHWREVIPQGHAERVRQALVELAGSTTRPAAAAAR